MASQGNPLIEVIQITLKDISLAGVTGHIKSIENVHHGKGTIMPYVLRDRNADVMKGDVGVRERVTLLTKTKKRRN